MTHAGHNREPDTRLDAYDPPCPEQSFRHPAAHEALVHAWDILRLLVARIGDPFQLWRRRVMKQAKRCEALDLLQPIELMLRRILFIEAQALAPGLALPPRSPAPPANGLRACATWRIQGTGAPRSAP